MVFEDIKLLKMGKTDDDDDIDTDQEILDLGISRCKKDTEDTVFVMGIVAKMDIRNRKIKDRIVNPSNYDRDGICILSDSDFSD
jgi:hypothetical protein